MTTVSASKRRRRFLVPEAIQTSAMDCGPACLKSVLEGFGIAVSYGRLREICHTSVDGTAVAALEMVLNELGLEASESLVPAEHLLMSQADVMPAIAITVRPTGLLHFIVVWRRVGPFVQVMDPVRGRCWLHHRHLARQLFNAEVPVPQSTFEDFITDPGLQGVVASRLHALAVPKAAARVRMAVAAGWQRFARLEGALRFGERLRRDAGFSKVQAARAVLALDDDAGGRADAVPEVLRLASPVDEEGTTAPAQFGPAPEESPARMVRMRGPVVVAIEGVRQKADGAAPLSLAAQSALPPPPATSRAFSRADEHPRHILWRLLRGGGGLVPTLLALGLLVAAMGGLVEALLFRAFFDLARRLPLLTDRMVALGLMGVFAGGLMLIEWPTASGLAALGRRLEGGLRRAFINRLPVFPDAYFQSRPVSDMATRAHQIHQLRSLPYYVGQILRVVCELLVTTMGLIWLHPPGAALALLLLFSLVALPLFLQAGHEERDMRMRAQAGALSIFYLDALLGLQAVRAHAGETALRREHAARLLEWTRAAWQAARYAVRSEAVCSLIGYGIAVWLLFHHLFAATGSGWALLLVYWTLSLPALGQEFAFLLQQIPRQKNLVARLLEPLQANTEHAASPGAPQPTLGGVALLLRDVRVQASGHEVLAIDHLHLPAGSHVALVGVSGSGKSSLLGLLLGWHQAIQGEVLLDGQPLSPQAMRALRRDTVWVDPAIALWNQSLLENLRYGAANPDAPVGAAIEDAELDEVLARLPTGLETRLGEGGGILSGGEGQRVRFGRSIQRPQARLVLFDEAFRGLEKPRRERLLARARARWKTATFICATHDVTDAITFDRVLVVDEGRIAEDGAPAVLAARPDGLFARFLAQDAALQGKYMQPLWRRWRLQKGSLRCDSPSGGEQTGGP